MVNGWNLSHNRQGLYRAQCSIRSNFFPENDIIDVDESAAEPNTGETIHRAAQPGGPGPALMGIEGC